MSHRRIVGAEMQNIVYGQYLPEVVGEAMIDSYNLRIDKPSDYRLVHLVEDSLLLTLQ